MKYLKYIITNVLIIGLFWTRVDGVNKGYQGKKIIAIIPVEAGDTDVQKKNIVKLSGKPLMAWTIEAAKKSNYLTDFYISTNGEKIIKIAEKHGAKVIKQPENLSVLKNKTTETIIYVLDELEKMGKKYDYVMVLQTNSPLRTAEHIDECIKQMIDHKWKSVVSIHRSDRLPVFMREMSDENKLTKIVNLKSMPEKEGVDKIYYVNAAISAVERGLLDKNFNFYDADYGYVMDEFYSVDVREAKGLIECRKRILKMRTKMKT